VIRLQLLRIDFPVQYEDMITRIQLQVQSKATKEYEQQVLGVVNDLSVLSAENDASVAIINAQAARKSLTIQNEAKASGMMLLQAARANATKLVADALKLSGAETVQYLKIQAIKSHPASRTTVGLSDPFPPQSLKSES
jgi:regulator of protease activity HflC (stomatin/prohibitin superfamily)